jgi:hypothetical protein
MDVNAIAVLLEKGGLPGLVVAAIILIWRFAPDRKTPEPAAQVVDAINAMNKKIDALSEELAELREQTIDRLARVETEVKNIKERK